MTKAYTQGKSCSFYCGYLGKITQFSKLQFNSSDIDKLPVGLYTITNINLMNSSLRLLNNKLNIYSNALTYPLPELWFLTSLNVTFDIIAGAYGSSIDFEFTPEMINGVDSEGVPFYSKYIGQLDSLSTHDSSFFQCSTGTATMLKQHIEKVRPDYKFDYFPGQDGKTGTIHLRQPRSQLMRAPHITSFITSYVRIQVL